MDMAYVTEGECLRTELPAPCTADEYSSFGPDVRGLASLALLYGIYIIGVAHVYSTYLESGWFSIYGNFTVILSASVQITVTIVSFGGDRCRIITLVVNESEPIYDHRMLLINLWDHRLLVRYGILLVGARRPDELCFVLATCASRDYGGDA